MGTETFLKLSDGGTMSLDWWPPPETAEGNGPTPPVVLCIPGFGNSSRSAFVRKTMSHLCSQGFQAVALNFRGMGHLELTSQRLGFADSWQDFPDVLRAVEAEMGDGVPIFAVGFSMGGVALLLHLIEHAQHSTFKAAVTVSAPIDYTRHGQLIKESPSLNFLMSLPVKMDLIQRRTSLQRFFPHVSFRDILSTPGLYETANKLMPKANGFEDLDDFFQQTNPARKMQFIQCPVLILQALDDPLIGPNGTPYEAIKANPNIIFAETQTGGHIGWAGRHSYLGPFDMGSWADVALSQFLLAQLKAIAVEGSCCRATGDVGLEKNSLPFVRSRL